MVSQPEDYQYSGHRAYLGLEAAGVVDVDPVLRHFGAKKEAARDRYREFVAAGMKHGHREEFYIADEGRILGTEEFVDATIHRIGEASRSNRDAKKKSLSEREIRPDRLVASVERVCRIPREDFCGSGKSASAVLAKEMLILIGLQMGASMKVLSELVGVSPSALSRRHDAARRKVRDGIDISKLASEIAEHYRSSE